MSKDQFDTDIEGQMNLIDVFDNVPERLIAVSRIFARARKDMTLAEQKTFVYALSQMRFTEQPETNYVRLDKKILARILGVKADSNHLSQNLFREIQDLDAHSRIRIAPKDLGLYADGFIITSVISYNNFVEISFNDVFLPLFTNLSSNYITLWSSDIFGLKTKRSVQFYEFLRQNTDTRQNINQIGLGIQAIKDMFGIPSNGPGAYMSRDGHFLRTSFEKKVINPLCDELLHTKMIQLVMQPEGKPYEKVKNGNRVAGYRFFWNFTMYPGIPSVDKTVADQEKADTHPAVPKAMKDIMSGESHHRVSKIKHSRLNPFNTFKQNTYDYTQLEKELLENSSECP